MSEDNTNEFGIAGLAITTPVLGRISIGRREERGDKVLPVRDDFITITSQVRKGLDWVEHPIQKKLEEEKGKDKEGAQKKLHSIPVTVMYNDPDLNIGVEYAAFDSNTGRQLCVGNGIKARRFAIGDNGTNEVVCPSPAYCEYAKQARCKLHARLNVQIEGQDDLLSSFIFRTSGFNSVRTLIYKLKGFHAMFNGKLRGLPLSLVMRAKSTTQSMGKPVFYLDLVLRDGLSLVEAAKHCLDTAKAEEEAGLKQEQFEMLVKKGLANSAFKETEEEGMDILNEFYFDEENAESDYSTEMVSGSPAEVSGLKALGKVLPKDGEKPANRISMKSSVDVTVVEQQNPLESTVDEASLSFPSMPPDLAASFAEPDSIQAAS